MYKQITDKLIILKSLIFSTNNVMYYIACYNMAHLLQVRFCFKKIGAISFFFCNIFMLFYCVIIGWKNYKKIYYTNTIIRKKLIL